MQRNCGTQARGGKFFHLLQLKRVQEEEQIEVRFRPKKGLSAGSCMPQEGSHINLISIKSNPC